MASFDQSSLALCDLLPNSFLFSSEGVSFAPRQTRTWSLLEESLKSSIFLF